ncbi:MAG TPA: glutamate mutase L, partial [Candidatus Lustribacter sp.]|nr:glutamate mutase L [Candidatus Lustribacter sp.]
STDQAEVFVNSSAAGGLRMTVHGLTRGMTARAAHEAALGAGGIVKLVTAGPIGDYDLADIRAIDPNVILLAGGVDYGDQDIVLGIAERLATSGLTAPIVYAGNVAIRRQVRDIFAGAGLELIISANVFPEVDVLDVAPLRAIVHDVFNRHIIHAPGMARLAGLSSWSILPTPGAVLEGAELFADAVGDCVVVDVGGATTDVHSVTDGTPEWTSRTIDPEPRAKRTVEGDLGVFVNAEHVAGLAGGDAGAAGLEHLRAVPTTQEQHDLTRRLCRCAVQTSLSRHAGVVTDLYTPTGRKHIVRGKDLTGVRWVVGTGGALTRVPGGEAILRSICTGAGKHLLPEPGARILIDRDYRFSALGTLAQAYPDEVKATLRSWVHSTGQPIVNDSE